jgi:hypothetical protein
MTQLPSALEPWRSSLEKLAPDLLGGFTPLVRRLSLAIGPYPAASRSGDGEPDGYDGLARRGLYERLLASEWLLASELPDEFLRRASSGEHAFLQLARNLPAGGRRSVALFDVGPSQLGTPRVAHLAALITLAHRAERAKVSFAWGILQIPGQLISDVTPSSVILLLAARNTEEATPELVKAWREQLHGDELWTVGSGLDIAVEDVLEPGTRQLEVRVRTACLRLELPSDDQCMRLVRDPYRVVVAPPVAHGLPFRPIGNPRFSADGRRLVLAQKGGGMAILPLPGSPRMTPGRIATFAVRDEQLVAVGGRAGQLWVAMVGGDGVSFYRLGKRGGIAFSHRHQLGFKPQPGPPFGTLVVHDGGFTFTDRLGMLFHIEGADVSHGESPALILDGTRPLWIDGLLWDKERPRVCNEKWQRVGPHLGASGAAEAFFGVAPAQSQLIAAVRQDDRWAIVRLHCSEPYLEATLHPSGHARVVGALLHPPSLLLLDEGRRSLSMVSRSLSRVVAQSSRPIADVTVSPRGTHAAWLTDDGALTVIGLGSREILLRVEAP